MPQHTRFYCSKCGESVYHCHVPKVKDGKVLKTKSRCPLVVYVVAGQPGDTGEPVDLNAVAVPDLVREMMRQPVARLDLCVKCFAAVFGLDLVPPKEPA